MKSHGASTMVSGKGCQGIVGEEGKNSALRKKLLSFCLPNLSKTNFYC